MSRSDPTIVTLRVHRETARAWLVSEDDDEEVAVWIPKSQCERGTEIGDETYEFELPEWLAQDKGFI